MKPIQLIDYSKINNSIPNISSLKAYAANDDIRFKYFNPHTNKYVDLTKYLDSIQITNNYSTSFMSLINIKLRTSNKIAHDVYRSYTTMKDSLYFELNIDRNIVNKQNLPIGYGSIYDILNTTSDSTTRIFGKKPYNDVKLVLVDLININPINEQDVVVSNIVDDNSYSYMLSLSLVVKDALLYNRKTFSVNRNAVTVGEVIKDVVKKCSYKLNELVIKTQPVDNTNRQPTINLYNSDFNNMLNELQNNVGTYIFGHKYYVDGKYLTLCDSQKELGRDDYDIHFEIMSKDTAATYKIPRGFLIGDVTTTTNKPIYCPIAEDSVQIINTIASTKELYGDSLEVSYKGYVVDVRLPKNLQEYNLSKKAFRKKTILKQNDSIFFETRIISEYNDKTFNMLINVENVDMDMFSFNKHVYVHYDDKNIGKLYNGKYKITEKVLLYDIFNQIKPLIPRVMLKLTKVVEELTYDHREMLFNQHYIDNKTIVKNADKQIVVSDLQLNPNSYNEPTMLLMSNLRMNQINKISDYRLFVKLNELKENIPELSNITISNYGLNYINTGTSLVAYKDILESKNILYDNTDIDISIYSGTIRISTTSKNEITPILGEDPKYPIDLNHTSSIPELFVGISMLQNKLTDITPILKNLDIIDMNKRWDSIIIVWLWLKSGALTRNDIRDSYQLTWMLSPYYIYMVLTYGQVMSVSNYRTIYYKPTNFNKIDNIEDISIGDIIIFKLSDGVDNYASYYAGSLLHRTSDHIYVAIGDIYHKFEILKIKYQNNIIYNNDLQFIIAGHIDSVPKKDSILDTPDVLIV